MAEFLELLDWLRATRDADSCLRGLNAFRAGLRGPGGAAFLARYLRQSPDWQELQAAWDTQLTVQHYHVTVTLLLALADGLRVACAGAADEAADGAQRAALAGGAARLAGAVLSRRLKALYFCLSSDQRGKANAALALLAATAAACAPGGAGAGAGGATLRDLVRAFDWSLSALQGLARPPREKKGESAAELRQRYWQQWALGDTLKRPTRALFCVLAAALLRGAAGDALLTQQLLALRPLAGGLLAHLAADPPAQQAEVLALLQRRVLARKAGVPAAAQAEAFSDAALAQLAAIAADAPVEGLEGDEEEAAEEEGEEGGAAGDGAAAQRRREQRRAAAAALSILRALATDAVHGLAAAPGAAAEQFCLCDAGSHQLSPGQRRLLRLLLRLRPADSAAHLHLLLAAAGADAPLAAALLLALPYSLEPAATAAGGAAAGRWFAHAGVTARLLQLLPGAAPPGLLLRARGGGGAPPPAGRRAQALLRCCFPPCLQRAALSRGVQHSNALVRHGTLGLLLAALSALEAVLADCSAAAAAAAGSPPQRREGWLALRAWLQQAARQQLPDPTLLLALLSAAEKEGWAEANELQLTAVLRALVLWQRLLPAALAEAHVDAERLLPAAPLALQPQHQLLLLELLQAAADAAHGGTSSGMAGVGASAAALLPALRLLAGSPQAAVRRAAQRWLLQRLLATAAFEGNQEEVLLWLDLLPSASEAPAAFLSEALQLLLRRPHELFELQQQLLAAVAAQGGGAQAAAAPPQWSLLALCALRQLLRVLGSAKMAGGGKAAAAAYVAAVLRALVQLQLGAGGAAALAAALLGVVAQEAQRQSQQAAGSAGQAGAQQEQEPDGGYSKAKKESKKRKSSGAGQAAAAGGGAPLLLPAEGAPLLALLAELEALLPVGGAQEHAPREKKARKSGSHLTAPGEGEAPACRSAALAGGSSAADGAAAAALRPAEACCLRISALAGQPAEAVAAAAEQLAAIQQQLSDSGGGGSGSVGVCSAAVRQCLCLLAQPGAAAPALLQVLHAAVLAAQPAEQRRCLQLLAESDLVAASLGASATATPAHEALGSSVAQLLQQLLASGSSGGGTAGLACQPLLELAAAAFRQLAAADDGGGGPPPAAARGFLLLLPHMPAAAVEAAAELLLPGGDGAGDAGSKKEKKRKGRAADPPAAGWRAAAAAAVVQELAARGGLAPARLEQACALLLRAAAAGLPEAHGCLLQLLQGGQRAAGLAALGADGCQQLLRSCLDPSAAGGTGLPTRAQLAAQLVASGGGCQRLAADLLPALLDGGGGAGLALGLPAAEALLELPAGEDAVEDAAAAEAVAAAATQELVVFFCISSSQQGGGGSSEAARLLRQHALPCLRAALRRAPLPAQQRQRALAALLPQQGWPTAQANSGSLGAAEVAAAAVALLTAPASSSDGGGGASVEELAACVACFAATLASLLKLPAGASELEGPLLALLDGPVGDAVAALPRAQRASPAFAELAAAAAGTLGTAVLRHRLAPPSGGEPGAAAAAEASVAALRVLRRFMAALLPDEEADASSSSSDSDSDSGGSDSEGDQPMRDAGAALDSPPVAAAAVQLLQRLLGHSRFLPAMRAAAASPPPLPPAAAAAPRPLASLLPLAAAADGGGDAPPAAPSQEAAAEEAAAAVKKELCELLETLLDLQQQYGGGGSDAAQAREVAAAEAALLPLLMAGYGASCSPTDAAVWSLAASINQRQWRRERDGAAAAAAAEEEGDGGDAEAAALAALLHGPLTQTCFAWGPAAAALQQLPAGDGEAAAAQRLQLLQQRLPLDPARAALTACLWPEACSLAAPGSSSQGGGASASASAGDGDAAGQLTQLPGAAAAYDPGFLLPFCVCALRQRLLPPRAFAETGLLSVCLRGLASADAGCLAASYQALALLEGQLGAATAADFREKQQLSVLLGSLRGAVTRPFQRLPAAHAVLLAEAALLALHPGAPLYPAVSRHLTRRAVLNTTDVPLLGQLLLSGGQQHAAERRWVAQLLLAGLRGGEDASLYRRKHAFEQAMALHDSSVADPVVAALALRLLCTATHIPRAARQLAQECGLIPWLAAAAQAGMQQQLQRRAGGGAGAAVDDALAAPLAALRRLLQLRAVMRGAGGASAAQQMAAAGRQLAAAALAAVGHAGAAQPGSAAAAVAAAVLPFLQDVQQRLGAGSLTDGGGGHIKHPAPGSGLGVPDLSAAVLALEAAAGHAAA